jgi:ABC-type nitrate/sulfonate/bicarbonate transport system substrate-binding protein
MLKTRISRRRFVGTVGSVVGGSLLLAACGDTPTATSVPATTAPVTTTTAATTSTNTGSTLKKVKVAVPSAFLLLYEDAFVAKEGKFWEKEGLDVELVTAQGNVGAFQQLSAKTAFAAYGSCIATLVARTEQDLPIRSVYPIHRELIFVIVTKNDGKIVQPTDLKDKAIGVTTRNGATEQLMTLLLGKYGIKNSEWKPVEVSADVNKAYGFLERGEVSAFVAINQAGLTLSYNQKPVDVLAIADFLSAPSGDITIHQDTAKDDPDTVMRFLRGLHNARKWIQDTANMDKVLDYSKVYVPNEITDRELAKLKIQNDIRLWTGKKSTLKIGQIDKAGWSELQDQMFANNFIKRKLELTGLIDTTFMEKIEP